MDHKTLNREYIARNGSKIILCNKTFNIEGLIGEGSSVVVYKARLNGELGHLKEFYPISLAQYVKRDKNGCLVYCDEAFHRVLEQYRDKYRLLYSRIEVSDIISNYIQHYDLFVEKDTTLYAWTPIPDTGLTLDRVMKESLVNPVDLCEKKLLDTLRLIVSLSCLAKDLLKKDIIYSDYKPSNILLRDAYDASESEISDRFLLFDIDSIQDLKGDVIENIGSAFFAAPEVKYSRQTRMSDLFSIAAILFNAIVIEENNKSEDSDDENKYSHRYYDYYDYDSIYDLVANSELIKNSEINSSKQVIDGLVTILKKSLHYNCNQRYQNYSEFIEDLKNLIKLIEGLLQRENLSLIDGKLREMNYEARLQLLLYKYPLFIKKQDNTTSINILVVGDDDISFKFIDLVLQCQIPDITHNINVIVNNNSIAKAAEERYFENRTSLKHFLDGSGSKEHLETLSFFASDITRNISNSKWITDMSDTIEDTLSHNYDYVFISLGNEARNAELSDAMTSGKIRKCEKAFVSYVGVDSVNLTNMRYDLSFDSDYVQMERYAFNSHLFWCSSKGLKGILNDRKEVDKKYYEFISDRYDYNSSLSFALSLPYKFYYLLGNKYRDMFNMSENEIQDLLNDEKVEKLAASEHRRWMVGYLVDSWDVPRTLDGKINYDYCVRMTLKLDVISEIEEENAEKIWRYYARQNNRQHLCLVGLDELDEISKQMYSLACRIVKEEMGLSDYLVQYVDYKKIDIDLIKNLPSIMCSENHVSKYSFAPKYIGAKNLEKDSYIPSDEEVDDFQQFLLSILYDRGWRYGREDDLISKRTKMMKDSSELTEEEREKIRGYIRRYKSIKEE